MSGLSMGRGRDDYDPGRCCSLLLTSFS
jgi:hypothetical protein